MRTVNMSRKRIVSVVLVAVGITVCWAVWLTRVEAQQPGSGGSVVIDNDDIGGVVRSTKGPEAGVWVIAETTDLPTKFARIVVTDEQGRYLAPDLPKANYKVWVRGYGLVDSRPVQAAPGRLVNLTAVVAPNPRAAAQYYPANYWYSLIQVPPKSAFPMVTGPGTQQQSGGVGALADFMSPAVQSQEGWIGQLKTGCLLCHQMGDKATREIPEPVRKKFPSSIDGWKHRIQFGQAGGPSMAGALARWHPRALDMFADWTDRIEAGEVPPAPPRPQGVERNVVITLWDWTNAKGFVHDEIATDKRNPTINANGPIYGVEQHSGDVIDILDLTTHRARQAKVPTRTGTEPITVPQKVMQPSPYWGDEAIWASRASLHNPMMDQKGRVWITAKIREGNQPDFCKEGSSHPSAKRFPLREQEASGEQGGRELAVYDPKTEKVTLVDTCYGTHHLQFAEDADHTLYTSGGRARGGVLGWIKTKVFDETGDVANAQGWLPYILDANGNGRLDEYVEPDQPADPTKDKRISSGSYGIIVNPVDGSVWQATGGGIPGHILRTDPKTGLTEIYQPPFHNPNSAVSGFTPRGIDADRNGLIWTSLAGSGHLASFDRRKCKVLNGPTATGPHCPEGWMLYPTPGPKFKGVTEAYNASQHYYNWVDQFDTSGLGKNVPFVNGTGDDSLIAFLPESGKFVTFRVPYPLGFYTRGMDGRIDDPNAGWKGKALWATYGTYVPWHIEGGKGTTSKVVKFQLRPDTLAK